MADDVALREPRTFKARQHFDDQQILSAAQVRAIQDRNPEGAATRGLWSNADFMAEVSTKNATLSATQFADYHGHGWNFRFIQKRAGDGTLLDADGQSIAEEDPKKFEKITAPVVGPSRSRYALR